MSKYLHTLFWLGLAAGTLVIAWTSLPYFEFDRLHPFLQERWAISQSAIWRFSLYLHVAAGIVCLLSALPQFQSRLLARWPRLHRLTGRVYGLGVLLLVVPTGLYLALFAKGGFWGQVGFTSQGLLLWVTTFIGIREAMRGRIKTHRVWMIRSYAVASAAITFRIVYIGLMLAGVSYLSAYLAGIWISFGINLFLGECVVHRRAIRRRFHQPLIPIQRTIS